MPINTYGLDYNGIFKEIDPNIYTSGFHYIGFMHRFIEYPTTIQTLDFGGEVPDRPAIDARTKDGLMVTFKAQFQYQINQATLMDMYLDYGEDY